MRAKDDHGRRLLTGDPREFACTVADLCPAIRIALEVVLEHDPLEQPLTFLLNLYPADNYVVGSAVAVNDMREDEPQAEDVAQT
jgi:hypothetical protein